MRSESHNTKFLPVIAAAIAAAATVLVWGLLVSHRANTSYSDTVEIPLYYDPIVTKNYFVQVQVGTKEGWMIVDTGCSKILLNKTLIKSEITKTFGLFNKAVFGFTGTSIVSEKVQVQYIRIANWELRNPVVNVANLPSFLPSQFRGRPVFGLLGYDLIRKWPFVRISKDRLVLSVHSPTLHAQTRSFPLRIYQGRPSVFLSTMEGDSFYLIDTGSDVHFISVKSKSSGIMSKLQSMVFAPISLRSIEGIPLWLPAIVKQKQELPFATFPPYVKGIIGSGILQRYEIVLDHRNLRVYFLPFSQTNQKGTYGFIPYTPSLRRLYGYFFVSPVSGDWVRVLSINDERIDYLDQEKFHQILQPPIGSVAKFTVATKSGKVQQFTCEAFSPEEIGLQIRYDYDNRKRLKSFRFHFSYR